MFFIDYLHIIYIICYIKYNVIIEIFLEDMMKNYWKDFSVYNINTIDRYASGFPLDLKGNYKTQSLNRYGSLSFAKTSMMFLVNFIYQMQIYQVLMK